MSSPLVELTILPREADIGGFTVRRLLPWRERRMVGPFIFLDHMGPASFAAGEGMGVMPHPHIGLATLTYLFEGEVLHRDTLGSAQPIRPGDVNLMTAGRGIAHSERSTPETRVKPHKLHGLQSWVALPKELEDGKPGFLHAPRADIPTLVEDDVKLHALFGQAYGLSSPIKPPSPAYYIDALLEPGAVLDMPRDYPERALYLIQGSIRINGETISAPALPVFAKGHVSVTALTPVRAMLLGGEPFPEQRYIWWNFVSSDKDRIEQGRLDWKAGKFGLIPGDEKEFVPAPDMVGHLK
jgi:redox-sensitive bicupin YhaK (pirin superfamily)